jgi:dipeptidyl aminopeptidase/acylaminoacyl peptidase
MNQKLTRQGSYFLIFITFFIINACTFLESSNLNITVPLKTTNPIPITTTAPVTATDYCNIISRISLDSNGNEGNDESDFSNISSNGQYAVFQSYANNLVTSDTNGKVDIFTKNLATGSTALISSDSSGIIGNNNSVNPTISPNGRYVVFQSSATNLVTGDTNNMTDVFMKDTQTGITTLISSDSAGVIGNNYSGSPVISLNGQYVVFYSTANNLVTGDTNNAVDIFMKNTQTGVTTLISSNSTGIIGNTGSSDPAISSDGRYIAFNSTANNLVTGDTNGRSDIFIKDTQTGITTLVSSDSAGTIGNNNSNSLAISSDGRYVAFSSYATNLIAGDTNNATDIFLKDTQTGVTTLVSSDSAGVIQNNTSYTPKVSSDGRYVVFTSESTNLVSGDTNGGSDIYLKDTQTGVTTLISSNSAGTIGNNASYNPAISLNNQYIVFTSYADNLVTGDTNSTSDIFCKDITK